MEVRTCRNCGRLFNYITGFPVCPACVDQLEKKFRQVKDFIRENPRSTVQEIADANEVSVKQLKQWIREERLTFSNDSPIGLECEKCGAMIKTGRFCTACKGKMADNLQGMMQHKTEPEEKKDPRDPKNRMRYL